jgi:AraC-like DNA-binding protein
MSRTPAFVTETPPMLENRPTDPLTEILRAMRLTGGVFLEAAFTSPWCVVSRVSPEDCAGFLPLPRHIIAYHFVCEGELSVRVDGGVSVTARRGEIVILPRNDHHLLGSDLGTAPIDVNDLFEPGDGSQPGRLVYGTPATADTRFFCGFLSHNQPDDPLLSALPRVLKSRMEDAAASDWVESSLRFASRRPTPDEKLSPAVLGKLAELLFIEAVRQYLQNDPAANGSGWIAGLRDPRVGRALALLHGQRERAWTTEDLAREVGLSRSAFAERFTGLVGDPPMRYLGRWRLQHAARRLVESVEPIARIAGEAGYESEPAFHRAFKREHRMTPASWRKQHTMAGGA